MSQAVLANMMRGAAATIDDCFRASESEQIPPSRAQIELALEALNFLVSFPSIVNRELDQLLAQGVEATQASSFAKEHLDFFADLERYYTERLENLAAAECSVEDKVRVRSILQPAKVRCAETRARLQALVTRLESRRPTPAEVHAILATIEGDSGRYLTEAEFLEQLLRDDR